MTNLESILKRRDITLPTKVRLVKAMDVVVMYGCESWTIKKAECRRIDPFELWCWRRLLRVPWTARRSSPSILKEISPEYSLEGLMLKLKLQYFLHLMQRTDILEKTLMLGKTEDRRRRGRQMAGWHHQLDAHEFEHTLGAGDGLGGLACCSPWGRKEFGHDWVTELNWTFNQALFMLLNERANIFMMHCVCKLCSQPWEQLCSVSKGTVGKCHEPPALTQAPQNWSQVLG